MSRPTPWQRVAEEFDRLCDLDPDARAGQLAEFSKATPELAIELERLLAADAVVDPRIDGGIGAFLGPSLAGLLEEELGRDAHTEGSLTQGDRIGPWRLEQRLGRGGMGEVWEATRCDGAFLQTVALKILRRGLDTEDVLARFLRERRLLARLQHPKIARLYDGGSTPDGCPWFAMEHVHGRTLIEHCDAGRLGVTARLKLFLDVCEAVEYAHRSLVIHRDLKPSNILVTCKGEIKLLDFGIAKLIADDEAADAMALTRESHRLLTPEYAAPEQLRGEPVTTATDVYALGVLLFELLVGRRPHRVAGGPPAPAAGDLCPPTRPSAAVQMSGPVAAPAATGNYDPLHAAAARGTQPERLHRRLRGDLDTIVLQALRDEPGQRYGSVQGLADDVRRHLEGRPVAARPAGVRYRAGKFLRRHRVGVAATTAIVLAIIGGVAGTAWQAAEARRERDAAWLKAQQLQAAQGYLVSLFEAADPAQALGETITARQLVERGVAQLDTVLAERPGVQLEMLKVLSRVEQALGQYGNARDLSTRALEVAARLHTGGHPEVAAAHGSLGTLNFLLDDWEAAEYHLREAIAIRRNDPAMEGELAGHLDELGVLLRWRGDAKASRQAFEEALAMRRRVAGPAHKAVALTLNNYAMALNAWGDLKAAEAYLREALEIHQALSGDRHPDLVTPLGNLAGVLRAQGRFAEAEVLYRETLELDRVFLGEDHPNYTSSLNNLAVFLVGRGAYEEAAELFVRVLEMDRQQLGHEHHYVAVTMFNLARALAEMGDFDTAMPLFREARALLYRTIGPDTHRYAACLQAEALALHYQGRDAEAAMFAEEAVEIYRRVLGEASPDLAAGLTTLARVRRALGETDAALAAYGEALSIQRDALPDPHPATAATLTGLAFALLERGLPEAAEPHAIEGLRMAEATLLERHRTRTEATAASTAVGESLAARVLDR